jgi:hypothetical protein
LLWEDGKAWINDGESLMGDLLGPFEDFKDAVLGTIHEITLAWDRFVDNISGKIDTITGLFSRVGGWFFGDSDMKSVQQNTVDITSAARDYNSNFLNSGAGSYSNSYINRNINVEVGGATINAEGMSAQQAQQAFGSSLVNELGMAIGQLNTGVDR